MARKTATTAGGGDDSPILSIPKPDIRLCHIGIVGEMPMISNAFSQKALMQILADHMQLPEAYVPHGAKDPVANFEACIHYLKDRDGQMHYAMPGSSFKAALVAACRMTSGKLDMTKAKQLFQVVPHRIRIYGDEPVMCEHRVRNTTGVIDIRHRAMFVRWSAILPIRYHAGSISAEVITSLAMLAGFGCGIGDWRIAAPKSSNGQMGSWRVAEEADLVGEEHTESCRQNPLGYDELEQYGVVRPERVAYYAECAKLPPPAPAEKPKKARKTTRRAPATAEAAAEVINGVLPREGLEVPPPNGAV